LPIIDSPRATISGNTSERRRHTVLRPQHGVTGTIGTVAALLIAAIPLARPIFQFGTRHDGLGRREATNRNVTSSAQSILWDISCEAPTTNIWQIPASNMWNVPEAFWNAEAKVLAS